MSNGDDGYTIEKRLLDIATTIRAIRSANPDDPGDHIEHCIDLVDELRKLLDVADDDGTLPGPVIGDDLGECSCPDGSVGCLGPPCAEEWTAPAVRTVRTVRDLIVELSKMDFDAQVELRIGTPDETAKTMEGLSVHGFQHREGVVAVIGWTDVAMTATCAEEGMKAHILRTEGEDVR